MVKKEMLQLNTILKPYYFHFYIMGISLFPGKTVGIFWKIIRIPITLIISLGLLLVIRAIMVEEIGMKEIDAVWILKTLLLVLIFFFNTILPYATLVYHRKQMLTFYNMAKEFHLSPTIAQELKTSTRVIFFIYLIRRIFDMWKTFIFKSPLTIVTVLQNILSQIILNIVMSVTYFSLLYLGMTYLSIRYALQICRQMNLELQNIQSPVIATRTFSNVIQKQTQILNLISQISTVFSRITFFTGMSCVFAIPTTINIAARTSGYETGETIVVLFGILPYVFNFVMLLMLMHNVSKINETVRMSMICINHIFFSNVW